MIKADVDGSVSLFHNDVGIVTTTATGVNINGICTAHSFSGSLAASNLTGALPAIDGSNLTGIAADKIFEGNTEAEVVDTGSDGHFKVTTEGGERFRIDPNGSIGVNITNPGVYDPNAESLVIGEISGGDGSAGMTIVSSATDKQGSIYFADGTGSASYRGRIEYKHNDNYMRFSTAQTERIRIDANGKFCFGTHTNGYQNNDSVAFINSTSISNNIISSSYDTIIILNLYLSLIHI